MPASFDVIVIGSGSAGFSAAEAARSAGASVCLIEKERLGGECPNWACVPSKALLRAARAHREARESGTFGVSVGGVTFDWAKVMAYRQGVVTSVTGGGEAGERYVRLARKAGIEVVFGAASFLDADAVEANGKRLVAKTFVVATGSSAFVPPIPGLGDVPFSTSREALSMTRLPKSMAIVGGGPVGCELATAFASFGTRVVLIQAGSSVLQREEPEIAAIAAQSLSDLGVEIVTDATVLEAINARGGVYGLKVRSSDGTTTHAVETVVVAAGKRANTEGLNLAAAGVRLDERGNVVTESDQRTTSKRVFAAGDVDGGSLFTHMAHHEGSVAGANAARAALGKRAPMSRLDETVVPRVTFVCPEVASVGVTTEEARRAYKGVLVGQAHISSLGRAAMDHAPTGLVRIVAHPSTRRVVGCHVIAPHAGEMIHEAALAIRLGATVDQVASLIHAYPTYSEAMVLAASNVADA